MDRLTVSEAADRLGISKDAVRKRLQRGTLPHAKKSDGQVYVYVDSNELAASQESATDLGDQTTLNYLDKLYNAWQGIDSALKRCTFWIIVISILVLALSGGAISTEDKLKIFGIGVRIPFVVLMTTGAILLAVFINMLGSLEWLGTLYEREIRRLYNSLGLADSVMSSPANPFMLVNVVDALDYTFAREAPALHDGSHPAGKRALNMRGRDLIAIFLLVILPTAAQAGAGYKISHVLGAAGPGWLSDAHAYLWWLLWLLPERGSSWVSGLFVVLAFATAIALTWQGDRASMSEDGSSATKGDTVVLYLIFVAFAYAGVWLGHFVAVR